MQNQKCWCSGLLSNLNQGGIVAAGTALLKDITVELERKINELENKE